MFCSWDAEEYGLIGSVEFAEVSSMYICTYNRCAVYWIYLT